MIYALATNRLFKVNRWATQDSSDPKAIEADVEEVTSLDTADIVTSQIRNSDLHTVVLDIDVPMEVTESTTPGHHHLFIDQAMTWDKYQALMIALVDAGIVEKGYFGASKARGYSAVRVMWKRKTHPGRNRL